MSVSPVSEAAAMIRRLTTKFLSTFRLVLDEKVVSCKSKDVVRLTCR